MIKKALMIFSVFVPLCHAAAAGELKTDTRSFPPSSSLPTPSLASDDVTLQGPVNNTWRFDFKSNTLLADIKVSVSAPTANYDGFTADFRVPYFWDNAVPRTLSTAVAGDQLGGMGALEFLKSVGAGQQDPSDLVVIHQRAARLWKERLDQISRPEVNPNRDDVRIAYWLVRSSRDLMVRQFMEVDSVTQGAMSWLQSALNDDHLRTRLFGASTAPPEEITSILRTLRAEDAFIYNKVVQALERDLAYQKPGTCERIQSASDFFSDLGDDIDQYDGQFENSVAIKSDLGMCMTNELRALPTGSDVPEVTVRKANTVADILRSASRGDAGSDTVTSRNKELAARLAELESVLAAIQAKAQKN
ncbi:hypothetical protein [Rhizobium sp. P44RR-XXIV]|uniref:hypothetical protein n=1 Tax=Rhizobium sp. P44RR-XXIV TaxID=1921145 RepID=UPI0009D033FC|nr:hypothetical protein [Rhizobium sp. P44RR-XXIV]TIX90507.1 hypothetical protein BSK43_014645 [Rhizobium sp. P44RR-XXIV]